jgi:thiosulfate reductase/polysulfide reductase chain A
MSVTRRLFLKTTAAAGAGAAISTHVPAALASVEGTQLDHSDEKQVAGVCLQCPGGCGISVRVVDGRAVKIEGNPDHPINLGKLCPKGQSGLQFLYDPDRIKGPMKRAGARGEGKWQPISWDEALNTVAARLRGLRDRGEAHRFVFMAGRCRGQMGDMFGRFSEAVGTPNAVGHSSICADGSAFAHWATQGVKSYAGYDWDNTNYILCFGAGFIEAWRPTTRLLRAFGHMRQGRATRGKLVQIDPRFSVTAAKADEWLPIQPGTDAALALGIAHVIVKENLYDASFVAEHTYGFDDFTDAEGRKRMGFKTLVLRDYPPARVAQITGIPEAKIVRIAREFATTRPAIAAGERGASMQTNGIYNRMAIHALNALVGSVETPGGVIIQHGPPMAKYPDVVKDAATSNGLSQPRIDLAGTKKFPLAGKVYQDLPDSILSGQPYPIDTLFAYYTNPFFATPDVDRWYRAAEKIPFIVTFSPFLDETTAMADLVLPDRTYLERWQDDPIYPSLGFPVVGIRQPAVKPLHDTRETGDVLIQLAHRIGGSVAQSFPWNSFLEVVQFRVKGIHEAQQGNIVAATFEQFWDEFTKKGFWSAAPYEFGKWEHGLRTPSKRFEFFSQNLEHKLHDVAQKEVDAAKKAGRVSTPEAELEDMLAGLGIHARGDEVYLPHYEPMRQGGDPKQYPFTLVTYKLMTHAEGRGANTPWLQEILGVHAGKRWDSWVEINPDAARQLGIGDGDEVFVESILGRIRTRALVYAGARPDVVNIPFELGHKAYGQGAKGRGVNPNDILVHENDRLGGLAAFSSTRVKVYKA